MKRRYIFILAFALGLLLFFGRYGIPKSDKPLGVFMTYGDEGQYYGFVNPKNNNVFLADISKIEDKKGNPLDLKDLNSGIFWNSMENVQKQRVIRQFIRKLLKWFV